MKDAQLVEARRDPDKKVEWAVTKLARLNKEKTLASKVLEVESGEPTTDAPPQNSEKDTDMFDTQESYDSAVGADIYEIDKSLIDDDSDDATYASDI
jgi:hypothetical protein